MLIKENKNLINKLKDISNPIIQFKIDKEILKKEVKIEEYISLEDKLINYWLKVINKDYIHGSQDLVYENVVSKLLEYGLTKENPELDEILRFYLSDNYWTDDSSFEGILIKTVLYPFLIRAGYYNNQNVNSFFLKRLSVIENTIDKYGYNFEEINKPKKYKDNLVFNFNIDESLPTIYDLYAFSYYPKVDSKLNKRIEKIVEYILDERFQKIPSKAYIYDNTNKRYYAVGNVYQACIIEKRKLLITVLLSNFEASKKSSIFNNIIKELKSYKCEDGFYQFDRSLLVEKKNSYHLYSGSHMGLGENRKNRNWIKIESTFWMLKILTNLED